MRDGPIERLQALVRIPTVSHRDADLVDTGAFDAFLAEHERCFPRLYAATELHRIGTHGLLLRWPGESATRPVVLMAHLDVVPVDGDAPWRHPPFGAEVHDGAVWGRGTLDDKGSLSAICEAVEALLAEGVTPAQDVWLSFGCDEEVSGTAAEEAVTTLRKHGVEPWFVLDEGGAIAHDAFPTVDRPVGVIGVTEKGTTSLRLTVEGRGGHASTPERNGPTTRLARAILRLERSPFPASTPAPTLELMRRIAPYAARPLGAVLARADRITPVLTKALVAAGAETAAMTRTTVAVTTLSGSPALNVIASRASAGVNVRVMVGDTVAGVVDHVRRAIRDDRVEIEVVEHGEPSPVSPYSDTTGSDEAFGLLERTITEVFPDAVPSPYVMMAATDARHFTAVCERVYRFTPFRMTKAQREAIHSYDEHVGVDDYLAGITWYRRLLEELR